MIIITIVSCDGLLYLLCRGGKYDRKDDSEQDVQPLSDGHEESKQIAVNTEKSSFHNDNITNHCLLSFSRMVIITPNMIIFLR